MFPSYGQRSMMLLWAVPYRTRSGMIESTNDVKFVPTIRRGAMRATHVCRSVASQGFLPFDGVFQTGETVQSLKRYRHIFIMT